MPACCTSAEARAKLYREKFCRFVIFCDAPCEFWGCKNRPTQFPGQMSYKATKPGLAPSVVYLSMFYIALLYIRAPFMYRGTVSFRWYVFCLLVVLVKLSLLAE